MPDLQPSSAAPSAFPQPCQPQPGSAHYPMGDTSIQCGPSVENFRRRTRTIPVTVTLTLAPGVELKEDATLSLLYVVNGSLDYSALFSQTEAGRHATVTFKAGQSTARFTITTLPIPSNSTFELEILAYPASVGVILSGKPAGPADDEKGLKALNLLSTAALVTALGALALALAKRSG